LESPSGIFYETPSIGKVGPLYRTVQNALVGSSASI